MLSIKIGTSIGILENTEILNKKKCFVVMLTAKIVTKSFLYV